MEKMHEFASCFDFDHQPSQEELNGMALILAGTLAPALVEHGTTCRETYPGLWTVCVKFYVENGKEDRNA